MPEAVEILLFEKYIQDNIGDKIKITYNSFPEIEGEELELEKEYDVKYFSGYGKKLFISINDEKDRFLIVCSFSMMGKWIIQKEHKKLPEYSSFVFTSNDKNFIFYCNHDWKYKAKIELFKNYSMKKYIKHYNLGLNAYDVTLEEWIKTWEEVQSRAKGEGRSISILLLEQSIIAGIGNYIRADMCYLAGIDPRTKVVNLNKKQIKRLYSGMKKVLDRSLNEGGYNGQNFTNPLNPEEKYTSFVYQQKQDPEGHPVKIIKENGRSLYWCPDKQC